MKREIRRPVLVVLLIIVIGLCLTALFNARTIAAQLYDWKLLPRQETLTELYFTNTQDLPINYTANVAQTLDFTVHNLEGRTVIYKYVITQANQDKSRLSQLASGAITVQPDAYRRQQIRITPDDLGRSRINVSLQPTGESINYWVNKE